jgi:hypothetical protein
MCKHFIDIKYFLLEYYLFFIIIYFFSLAQSSATPIRTQFYSGCFVTLLSSMRNAMPASSSMTTSLCHSGGR